MKTQSEYHRNWYQRHKAELRPYKRDNMKRYRQANSEKYAEQSRQAKQRLRDKIFSVFGEVCVACGFSDKRAITLDHILNNGAKEREEIGERGVYLRALKSEHRHEYQMLCMNCQFIKRHEPGGDWHRPAVVKLAWETLSQ